MRKRKVAKVMGEFKRGELHSGSKKGPKVKSRKQATAIGMSEARKAGEGGSKRRRNPAGAMSTDDFEKRYGRKRIDR